MLHDHLNIRQLIISTYNLAGFTVWILPFGDDTPASSMINSRYYHFAVFCFSADPLYHIFLRDDPRFRRNSIPLFSPAVSSSARRFIILFLYRDRFFAVERNARDVAQLKYTKIACKVMIAKVREKNMSQQQNK